MSLAVASDYIERNFMGNLYIAEGDSIIDPICISKLVSNNDESSVILRPVNNITNRSVVAVSRKRMVDNKVTGFIYDQEHKDVLSKIPDGCKAIGESMQIWKFTGNLTKALLDYLRYYKCLSSYATHKMEESGVYSINKIISDNPMSPVMVKGDNWINLNTPEDYNNLEGTEWIRKLL
jgi:choline kinase